MPDLKYFPKAYVVILNWNGRDDTLECIKSVKNISYPDCGIILVDNGSKDNSIDSIKETYKDIIFIKNKINNADSVFKWRVKLTVACVTGIINPSQLNPRRIK